MAYQYRGTGRDVEEPTPIRSGKLTGFDPSACGTYAGYRRHRKHNIPACQDCKDAQAAYSRARYTPAPKPVFRDDACGTWAGWQRHIKYDVEPCEPCRAATREYQRIWRATRKQQRARAA
ncbi:hypothetical protein PV761_03375 [Arthrobacter sp. CC3]|uniref:hypothetical protein n=1 Tax=Arthrobacter sp. CC3 TaxID=3029185 RepID=UPI003262E154